MSTGIVEPILIKKIQPYAFSVEVDLAGGKYYWSNWFGIQRCNFDGSEVETIYQVEFNRALGIALDVDAGKIYCALGYLVVNGQPHFGKIIRTNLDGSDLEELIVASAKGPVDVALDLVHQKMYWTDWTLDVIRRANLDGTQVEDVVITGFNVPKGIAVDTLHEKIYWTDYGGSGPSRIKMANLDGSGVTPVFTQTGMSPVEIAVDPVGGHIFWIDESFTIGGVWRSDLDGANAAVLVEDHTYSPWGIVVAGGRIYWGDYGFQTMFRAELSGASVEDLFKSPLEYTQRMAINPAAGQMYWVDYADRYGAEPGIKRAKFNGDNVSLLFPPPLYDHALAIDPSSDAMYALSSPSNELIRSNLDGDNAEMLLDSWDADLEAVGGIVLDVYHGHIFISGERYPSTGYLVRFQLNGTQPVDISTSSALRYQPGPIAFDHFTGRLYWRTMKEVEDHTVLVIEEVDRSGGAPQVVLELAPKDSYGDVGDLLVSAWERKLYWTHASSGKIQRADLDGTNIETVSETGGVGLAMDPCSRVAPISLQDGLPLAACLSGPAVYFPENCVCSDFTTEGLVDLRDYSVMQLTYRN